MQQEAGGIKSILGDRRKVAYILSSAILAIFAYALLVGNDMGGIMRSNRELGEIERSVGMLKGTSGHSLYLSEFRNSCARNQDANALINIIMTLARDTSVVLGSLKPVSTTELKGFNIVRVTVDGEAQYSDLLRFVENIERYEKRIYIEECGTDASKDSRRAMINEAAASRGFPTQPEMARVDGESGNLVKFKLGLASITVTQ